MPLTFKVTTAGRAALVNAANTGTLPVLVSQIGVTATGFTAAADGSDLALPGELKRLSTFGAAAVADDTIHTVIRDESGDTYSLRGFALYLADGTPFGLYGQADVIVEKSAAAMMLLATDIIFADIDAANLTFGNTNFLNPPGTVDTLGVLELATDAETITGTDAVRAVTPKGLMAKLVDLLGAGAPSAYVKTLLTAVDRVAFRTLLSIKTAASYDIGVGNGLDADLLDGQHGAYYCSYANLTGVPETFPAEQHTHAISEIDGLATALAAVASTEQYGKIKLATDAEARGLANAANAITPATLRSAFSGSNQLLTQNGFQKIPGGLIIQWMNGSFSSGQAVTFPISFPNACLALAPMDACTDEAAQVMHMFSWRADIGLSKTGFTVAIYSPSRGDFLTTSSCTLIALGY